MGAVLLDTTVLIDVLRGRAAADRIRAMRRTGGVPFTCAVNIEELTRGLHVGEAQPVGKLLNGLRIAPLGRAEGEMAGAWRRAFAARGRTLSQADCLIAAAAAALGATLATGNPKDFPMPELRVEHWRVGV